MSHLWHPCQTEKHFKEQIKTGVLALSFKPRSVTTYWYLYEFCTGLEFTPCFHSVHLRLSHTSVEEFKQINIPSPQRARHS